MNEVEYILRIVLRARDELAAGLAKARTQLRGFKTDAQALDGVMKNLNANFDKFNTNVDGITKKLQAWQATLRAVNDGGKGLSKTFDDIGKSAEASSRKVAAANKTQEQLQETARNLRKEMGLVQKAHNDGAISVEFAAKKYRQLADDLEAVALKMTHAARTKTPAHVWAEDVKLALEDAKQRMGEVEQLMREQTRLEKENDRKRAADQKAAAKEREEALASQLARVEAIQQEVERLRLLNVKAHNKRVEDEILGQIGRLESAQQEAERIRLANVRTHNREIERELLAQIDREGALRKREQQIAEAGARVSALRGRARGGIFGEDEIREARALEQAFRRLSSTAEVGSDEFHNFGRRADELGRVLRSVGREAESTGGRVRKGLVSGFLGAGDSVAALDNKLRGIVLLAVASFIEQLTTAVVGLSGELVSLAGSAAMAGGALGGILAAGAAQALPVIGLLAGAVSRVNAVMDAFQQNQKLQQAQATDAEKRGQKSIDQANSLASAQDSVVSANERLAEARKNLTQAQKDGEDQLDDLILKEKEAALAARGASLNVKEAQQALQQAVAGGASSLEIQQRQLAVDEARLGRTRARREAGRARGAVAAAGGDIGNLESVQNAEQALKQAQRAAEQAGRGLDQAQDKAERAASTTMTAAATLNYLLSQMSPAERKLYTAVNKIYTDYRRIFIGDKKRSGIYGTIISSFADAVDQVDRIMQRPKVIKTIQNLANEIAKQFRKITAFFTGDELDQFVQITQDAKENLGPLVDLVLDLADAFTNIATEANPALQQLLEYLKPIFGSFLGLTENKGKMEDFFKSGEEHLETWLDLIFAIIGLFAELFGASADTGKRSIEDLTDQVKEWTKWLEDNGDKVRKFFDDAYNVVKTIAGVVGDLAGEIFKTFTPEHLKEFATFLEDTVLPALGGVVRTMGDITDFLLDFVNSPIGGQVAKFGLMGLAFAQIATSLRGALGYFDKLIPVVGNLTRKVGTKFSDWALDLLNIKKRAPDAGDALKKFGEGAEQADTKKPGIFSRVFGGARAAAPAAAPVGGAAVAETFLAGGGGAAAGAGAGGAAAGGAAAAGISATGVGAIVLAVVALLAVTGQLSKIWKGVKEAASDFIDTVTPALDDLKEALEELGITGETTSDVLGVFWDILKGIGEYIGSYLISIIKGLGDIFGGVIAGIIDVIAGLIKYLHGVADLWIGIFTLDGDQIKKGWEEIKDGLTDIVKGLISAIRGILKGVGRIIIAPFKAAWDALKEIFGWDSAKDVGKDIVNGIISGVKGAARGIAGAARWLWDKLLDFLKLEIKGVSRIGTWIKDALSNAVHGIGSALGDIGGRIIHAVVEGIKRAPLILAEAIAWVIDKLPGPDFFKNKIKTFLKLDKIDAAGLAAGGPVPGSGSGDTVPALLTPGEHVWTKREVESAGGHGVMFALRRLLGGGGQGLGGRFQPGGVVDPRSGLMHGVGGAAAAAQAAQERQRDLSTEREDYKKSNTQRAEDWRVMWNDMLITTRRFANDIEEQFRQMRVNTSRSVDRMYRDIRGSLADIENSFAVRGGNIVESWSAMWHSLQLVAYNGLNYIAHQTNLALKGLGEKTVSFGLTRPKADESGGGQQNLGQTGHLASGGFVGKPGMRGRDQGLYALGAGEAVLNHWQQAVVNSLLPGGTTLGSIFALMNGFHAGGGAGFARGGIVPIPGQPGESIASSILNDVQQLIRQYKLTVTDGWAPVGTHATNSDHHWGGAVDVVPDFAKGGSWSLVTKLAHLAEPSQNHPVSPWRWVGYDGDTGHGEGNHLHLSWLLGKNVHGLADISTSIMRQLITGPNGALKTYAQSALDATRKVANEMLDGMFTTPVPETEGATKYPKGALSQGQVESTIKRALNILKITSSIALWVKAVTRQASRESTFNPNAQNNTAAGVAAGGPKGIMQVVDGTFAAYSLPGHKNVYNPLDNIIAAVRYVIERYGGGDPDRGAAVLWGRGGGAYAEGGIVPGGDGTPMHIMAHAGEWILNKLQQSRIASWLGTSREGLGSVLGFYGGEHFQGGGDPAKRRAEAAAKQRAARVKSIETFAEGVFSQDSFQSVTALLLDIGQIFYAFKRLGKVSKSIKGFTNVLDVATRDGGLLDQLRAGIERSSAQARLKIRQAAFTVAGGVVKKTGTDIDRTAAELRQTQAEREDLRLEKLQIDVDLAAVNRRLRRKNLGKKAKELLESQRNNLQQRQDDAAERVQQNIEDLFAAQEAAQQAVVDAINKDADTAQGAFDIAKRVATAMGQSTEGIDKQIKANLEDQRAKLLAALPGIEASGATDLADTVRKQAEDLRAQIAELAARAFQDSIDAINETAQRELRKSDLFQRMLDVSGTIGGKAGQGLFGSATGMTQDEIFKARGDALTTQRGGLAGKLSEAQAAGNTKAVEDLTFQLAEVDVAIAENTKAQRDAADQAKADAFDYNLAINDLDMQLLGARDAISGLTSTTEKLALLNDRVTLLSGRHNELLAMQDEARKRGDDKAVKDLEKQLKQNELATLQNTQAINEVTGEGSAPQTFASTAWAWFGQAFFGGTGRVLPNYQLPSNMAGIGPMGSGGAGPNTSVTNQGGNTYVTTVEVNEAGQPVDATHIGSVVTFAQSTAQ